MKVPQGIMDVLVSAGFKNEAKALLNNLSLPPDVYDELTSYLGDSQATTDIPTQQVVIFLRQLREMRRRRQRELEEAAEADPNVELPEFEEAEIQFPEGSIPNYLEMSILSFLGFEGQLDALQSGELVANQTYSEMLSSVEAFRGRKTMFSAEASLLAGKLEDLVAVEG